MAGTLALSSIYSGAMAKPRRSLWTRGVLRPGETNESLYTTESSFRLQAGLDRGSKAGESAESTAQAALGEAELKVSEASKAGSQHPQQD